MMMMMMMMMTMVMMIGVGVIIEAASPPIEDEGAIAAKPDAYVDERYQAQ
jgi:hypothetical protein